MLMAQLSADVAAVHVTFVPHALASLVTVMLAGVPEITGSWLSTTVTVKVDVATLPWMSVAVYVTVVTPTGKRSPEAAEPVKV